MIRILTLIYTLFGILTGLIYCFCHLLEIDDTFSLKELTKYFILWPIIWLEGIIGIIEDLI